MKNICDVCGKKATHQCNLTSNEVCTTWLCDSCCHLHPTNEELHDDDPYYKMEEE
jgi:hypothetical protein